MAYAPLRPPLAAGNAHLVEQHLAQLLGRADVERVPRERVDFGFQVADARLEVGAQAFQLLGIDSDAGALHVPQHRDQGALQRLVDGDQALGHEPRLQEAVKGVGDVRVLRCIGQRRLDRHPVEGHLGFPGSGHLGELDGLATEMKARELVHAVAVQATLENEGQHLGVVHGRRAHAMAGKHVHVVLDVLAHLEDGRILEHRLEDRERVGERDLPGLGVFGRRARKLERALARRPLVGERDIARSTAVQRQRHPHQLGAHGVQ